MRIQHVNHYNDRSSGVCSNGVELDKSQYKINIVSICIMVDFIFIFILAVYKIILVYDIFDIWIFLFIDKEWPEF